MSRFLRRAPVYRSGRSARTGWITFPSYRSGELKRIVSVVAAFSLAFLFAWENIYVDQLLSELQKRRQTVENLKAQVAEAETVIKRRMILALSEAGVSRAGLRAPDVEQVVLLSESSRFFGEPAYSSAQLSSLDHIQQRVLEFFVSTALARASRSMRP